MNVEIVGGNARSSGPLGSEGGTFDSSESRRHRLAALAEDVRSWKDESWERTQLRR